MLHLRREGLVHVVLSVFMQLRKLLHHFPRTYADLQNAQIDLDDGQYFIFIGEIISSRYLGIAYEQLSS